MLYIKWERGKQKVSQPVAESSVSSWSSRQAGWTIVVCVVALDDSNIRVQARFRVGANYEGDVGGRWGCSAPLCPGCVVRYTGTVRFPFLLLLLLLDTSHTTLSHSNFVAILFLVHIVWTVCQARSSYYSEKTGHHMCVCNCVRNVNVKLFIFCD